MFRILTLALFLVSTPLAAELVEQELDYSADETTLKGYLVYDDAIEDQRPGVLVVHEWWGHNDYARKRARMLAEMGYTALAVDMYGDGATADHPKEAGKFAGMVSKNLPLMKTRFLAALDVLKQQPTVDPNKTAAIGYCFGGGVVLEMARQGADLNAVASFHGGLGPDAPIEKGSINAAILVANGAEDPMVSEEQIIAFKEQMDNADADYLFINYPGAKHSFTNPDADKYAEKFDLPLGYDKAADDASWAEMQKLFNQVFN